MAELTKEQIERAAIALWEATYPARHHPKEDSWNAIAERYKAEWRVWAVAAAPFLQLPWDLMSSVEECQAASSPSHIHAVNDFIRLRNAAQLPKPIDPRREKIMQVFADVPKGWNSSYMADQILAALDKAD